MEQIITEDDKFVAQENAVIDELMDKFIEDGLFAETVIMAAGIYAGLVADDNDDGHWSKTLQEFIEIGRSIRDDGETKRSCS